MLRKFAICALILIFLNKIRLFSQELTSPTWCIVKSGNFADIKTMYRATIPCFDNIKKDFSF